MSSPAAWSEQAPAHEDAGPNRLVLRNARLALNATTAVFTDIEIADGRIHRLTQTPEASSHASKHDSTIDLAGWLLLPGLINAHDHLEFSLFPKLGRGPYPNARAWAEEIYQPDAPLIAAQRAISKATRLRWGGIKNLISGVTTVCHHNPFHPDVFQCDFPVRVVNHFAWAHSLTWGDDIRAAFHASDPNVPFIIHLAEGTDEESRAEIFELDRLGILTSRTVIVHGVALDDEGYDLLSRRGAALIWCPGSNLFNLGSTVSVDRIRRTPRTALGSDSAMTAGDLLEQVGIARSLGIEPNLIYELVTTRGAELLELRDGEGAMEPGSVADLVAVPDRGLDPCQALVETTFDRVGMVVVGGAPRLLCQALLDQVGEAKADFRKLLVDGVPRFVRSNISQLIQEAQAHLGPTIHLAHREVRE